MKCDQANSTLKGVSHWGATVGDKSGTAFARELPKCIETFTGIFNFLAD